MLVQIFILSLLEVSALRHRLKGRVLRFQHHSGRTALCQAAAAWVSVPVRLQQQVLAGGFPSWSLKSTQPTSTDLRSLCAARPSRQRVIGG